VSPPLVLASRRFPTPPEAIEVCDTSRLRHLGLLAARTGNWEWIFGPQGLTVPRQVVDPEDPVGGVLLDFDPQDLCELAQAERHHYVQYENSRDPEAWTRAQALELLRRHPEMRVVDPTAEELDDMEVLKARATLADPSRRVALGLGERAVLAIASNREWLAGLDDGAARAMAVEWDVTVRTTQDWLRGLASRVIDVETAEDINDRLLSGGFRGRQPLLFDH
jgi:predicted nucleic acid-binding protein